MQMYAAAGSLSISIHALREEGDFSLVRKLVKGAEFLSTPSARRATNASCLACYT